VRVLSKRAEILNVSGAQLQVSRGTLFAPFAPRLCSTS